MYVLNDTFRGITTFTITIINYCYHLYSTNVVMIINITTRMPKPRDWHHWVCWVQWNKEQLLKNALTSPTLTRS